MRGAPVPPEEYADDGERVLTDAVLDDGGWASGLKVWEQMGKAYEWYLGQAETPDGLDNAQMWSLQEAVKAQARRGDPVEAWIKRTRDALTLDRGDDGPAWHALNDLLDDYRDHADTGTPLGQEVRGPHGDEG
jgi:hypothetical protein